MKYLVLLYILLITYSKSHSQFVVFDWAKSLDRATGFSGDETYLVGTDAHKNVYVAGNFRNTMDLDPGPGVFTVSAPMDNMFVVKLDSFGNFIWGKKMGGDRFTYTRSMFVDTSGNIYSTGRFSGTSDFDPGPGVYNLVANSNCFPECAGIFISKLDSAGNFKWAKQIGGDASEYDGHGIKADTNGNVYITGYFVGVTDLDPGSGVLLLGSDGVVNTFITKLDLNGNLSWSKAFLGNYSGQGMYIDTDLVGNVYISGNFEATVDFDPGPAVFNLSAPVRAPYIAKLNSNGAFVWAKKEIGGRCIAIDAAENVYTYTSTVPAGVISKYDPSGNMIWTKSSGGGPEPSMWGSTLFVDNIGNIYTTGRFRYTQDFDPGPAVYNLTAFGNGFNSDVSLCRWDTDGNFLWAKSFGGWSEEFASSIFLDKDGAIYTSGIYNMTVDFDPGPGVFNMTPGIAGGAIFIHKMERCNNATFHTINATACNSYQFNNQTYYISGIYNQVLQNVAGCDSIITLNLLIGGSNDTLTTVECDSSIWNNQTYFASGFYRDTLTDALGCDSIINLSLTIKRSVSTIISTAICEGQNYAGYILAGTYRDTFTAANGCDSIRTLVLAIKPRSYTSLDATICQGDQYLGYSVTGVYRDTLIAANGCDSIRTLNLLVNRNSITNMTATICEGQTYYAGGANQSVQGTYRDTLQNISGCDSVIVTRLNVNPSPSPNLGPDRGICTGQGLLLTPGIFTSYEWHDQSVTPDFFAQNTGIYWVKVTQNNCVAYDTIIIDHFLPAPSGFLPSIDSICQYGTLTLYPLISYQNYSWSTGSKLSSITIDQPGNYVLTVRDINGCTGLDTVRVVQKTCNTGVFLPSAFTPNNDGKNDVFRPKVYGNTVYFKLQIYNRWGEVIFSSKDPSKGWNGTVQGMLTDTGVYVWQCEYQLQGEQRAFVKGTVALIR